MAFSYRCFKNVSRKKYCMLCLLQISRKSLKDKIQFRVCAVCKLNYGVCNTTIANFKRFRIFNEILALPSRISKEIRMNKNLFHFIVIDTCLTLILINKILLLKINFCLGPVIGQLLTKPSVDELIKFYSQPQSLF